MPRESFHDKAHSTIAGILKGIGQLRPVTLGSRMGDLATEKSVKKTPFQGKAFQFIIAKRHPHFAIVPPLETKLIDIPRNAAIHNDHRQIDLNAS